MEEPSDNVFIADLPLDFDEEQLKIIFGEYGTIITCRMLTSEKDLKGGRRAALIRFQELEEAKWVVENLNGNIPQGLNDPIIARYKSAPAPPGGKSMGKFGGKPFGAAERPGPYAPKSGKAAGGGKAPPGGKGSARGASQCDIRELVDGLTRAGALPGGTRYENDDNALFVGGLPHNTTDLDLYKIFSPFGAIAPKGIRAMLGDGGPGTCNGIAFVNFLSADATERALLTLSGTGLPDGSVLRVSRKAPPKNGKGKS